MENLKIHLRNSTIIAGITALICSGFVAFTRITAETSTAFSPLKYSSVVTATVLSAYSAYWLLQLLKKYVNRPYEIFMYISGLVLFFSYMPTGHLALDMEGAGMAEINVLGTLHALAAIIILTGIAKLEMMKKN